MPFTEEGKALMLWYLSQNTSHASLHSSFPAANNELPSNGIYSRAPVRFSAPHPDGMRMEREIEFEIPPDLYFSHVGFWSAPRGGVCFAWSPLPKRFVYRGRGTFALTQALLHLNLTEDPRDLAPLEDEVLDLRQGA